MGQSYLKNAALLTGADVLLRLAGMGLRIYLANALGGEGMGLYQLVLAVYSLFVTLATAGVSVAATRLMAEELARGRAQARGMLVRLAGTGLLLGATAMAAQYGLAGVAARWWLGDVRAAGALRVSAFGMPWMALSAVLLERKRLAPLRAMADMVVNTTRFSIHDLRRVIQRRFRSRTGNLRALRVNIISFGFKYGVPREADYVFDLRFLPNPYFVSELRAKSGKDSDVADYVFATPKAREFRTKLLELIFFILPLMENEGRYRLTIAFGCTGGRHRSVAVAEAVHTALHQAGYPVTLEHRHLELG